jgi:hypothetical protein
VTIRCVEKAIQRSHSQQQIDTTLLAIAACAGNCSLARRVLVDKPPPERTMRRWRNEVHAERYIELSNQAAEAGAEWAGFHTFRHSYASLHVERGTNIVQLSRLLGHHSASFTLTVYADLIDGNVGTPLVLSDELRRDNGMTTRQAETALKGEAWTEADEALVTSIASEAEAMREAA